MPSSPYYFNQVKPSSLPLSGLSGVCVVKRVRKELSVLGGGESKLVSISLLLSGESKKKRKTKLRADTKATSDMAQFY
jgi:hypothetical protein